MFELEVIYEILFRSGYSMLLLFPLLICVAYLIYAERKVIGWINLRHGPSVVGPFGLFQPFADAIKLITKEFIFPESANRILFLIAPILLFSLALSGWAVIPFGAINIGSGFNLLISDLNVGILYIMALSSLNVYSIILAGWASRSNYSFLGALRSASQMISYEVVISIAIIAAIIPSGSFKLADIVEAHHNMPYITSLALIPMAIVFFISILAETNRHPFDLPEAESELVAGYNVEYSSMLFAMFFLGEYANMILTSAIMTVLFLGGWYPPIDIKLLYLIPAPIWMIVKIAIVLFTFIWIRATFPRYRYDQLMSICWKILLPFSLIWMVVVAIVVKYVA